MYIYLRQLLVVFRESLQRVFVDGCDRLSLRLLYLHNHIYREREYVCMYSFIYIERICIYTCGSFWSSSESLRRIFIDGRTYIYIYIDIYR